MFLSQGDFSASSAVIRFSGSNSSILSSKSNADFGSNLKSSRNLRRCNLLGFSVWNKGSFITEGHTAGVGVPHKRDILSNCIISALACNKFWLVSNIKLMILNHTWNRGFFWNNSPRIHPQLQMSMAGPYRSSPSKSSGGRYHNVMTLLV